MSLRKKIIISWFICITFIFVPFIYIMQTKLRPLNLHRVEYNTLQVITSKANEIGMWLNQKISEIEIIKEFPAFHSMDLKSIQTYLNKINTISRTSTENLYESFLFIDNLGNLFINNDLSINISDEKYFKDTISSKKQYIISKPMISSISNQPVFVISYPLKSIADNTLGIIYGSINLDIFSKITGDIDLFNGFSWIMDKDADVYTSTTRNFDTLNLCRKERQLILKEASKSPYGIIDLKPLIDKDSLVFYSSVPSAEDWILCSIIEKSDIQAQTNEFIEIVFKVLSLLLIASIVISVVISGAMTKSLKSLTENMLQVSNGNLKSYYTHRSKDEISTMGNVFNKMLKDINNLIIEKDHAHELKRNAELKALQSQINPHFLYNTLDTIQWKALGYEAYDVVEMIQLLSKLFRLSLNNGNEFTTLKDEVEHIETYLKIQKIRYSQNVNYNIHCNIPNPENYNIPKLIIQPLIENSIYHGIKQKKSEGYICVTIDIFEGMLIIKIEDNGIGIPEETLNKLTLNLNNSIKSDSYGLYNVNERLKLTFGSHCKFILTSNYTIGTTVYIKIPLTEDNNLDKITYS